MSLMVERTPPERAIVTGRQRKPVTGGKFEVARIGIALAAYDPPIAIFVEQLESIRVQDFSDWVCLILLDSPLDPLRQEPRLLPYFQDQRFHWRQNPERLGHKKNFEQAIQLVLQHGVDAIATADQDDVWYPEKLSVLAARLESAGPMSMIHSDMDRLERDGSLNGSVWRQAKRGVGNARPHHMAVRNIVTGCSMLFDADLAARYPTIPETFKFHDQWYAFVASCSGSVLPVAQALLAYRQHGGNVIGAESFEWSVRLPVAGGLRGELRDCQERWLRMRARVESARLEGVRISGMLRWLVVNPLEPGIALMALGLFHTFGDPRLSRYCIRIGIGKAIDLVARALGRRFPSRFQSLPA